MTNIVSRMMFAAAAASMAFAPIAAQAGTRASDSTAVYSAAAVQSGMGDDEEGAGLFNDGTSIILALVAAGLIITGIVLATQSDDDGQSPGT